MHYLNYFESGKIRFSISLAKALRTDERTDQPTDQRTDKASYRDARTHLKKRIDGRKWTWECKLSFMGEFVAYVFALFAGLLELATLSPLPTYPPALPLSLFP